MSLPFFYTDQYDSAQRELTLDEDASRHLVQVLRMKEGEQLHLTDGKGTLLTTSITDGHKKHCTVRIDATQGQPRRAQQAIIGISLLKNASRFEWFLEKATELGVSEIIPLICDRTEKQKFRRDRLHMILVSAMLQSQQTWLPTLHEPIAYDLLFRMEETAAAEQKYIAHCLDAEKSSLAREALKDSIVPAQRKMILIGPEGDFSIREIELAMANHFVPVTLGVTRLRTETAGMVAATVLTID
ncbi:MAG: 16S rRNA (uracil(1498)-N(3))-methyltransferase [Chitinophagaceae bacterium]|nr:16S rRNA (uracil(1498)-N(3))-methyltransferase [Chitinophagaceae bacterium]